MLRNGSDCDHRPHLETEEWPLGRVRIQFPMQGREPNRGIFTVGYYRFTHGLQCYFSKPTRSAVSGQRVLQNIPYHTFTMMVRSTVLWSLLLQLVPLLLLEASESSSLSTFDLAPFTVSSLDILHDESTRAALKKLRTEQHDSRGRPIPKTHAKMLASLEDLYTAGNTDKSTMSLRGNYDSDTNTQNAAFSIVVSPFLPTTDDDDDDDDAADATISQFMGVFDGHFGYADTSRFLSDALPKRMAQKLLALDDLTDSDAVTRVIQGVFQWADRNEPTQGYGGSTASILMQLNDTIYIANAGTSQTFVGVFWEAYSGPRKNDISVVLESPTTTPDEPGESERILQSGGIVQVDDEGISRVYPPNNENLGHPGIAMSRSIGDWSVFPGVIAEPKIGVFTLDLIRTLGMQAHATNVCRISPQNEEEERDDGDKGSDEEQSCPAPKSLKIFAMATTGAVLDYPEMLSPAEMARGYAASFFVDGNSHPHTISEATLIEAAHAWEQYEGQFRPDMAVAACKIWDV
jgi:hypothetical protein